jgi:hypothetical protein
LPCESNRKPNRHSCETLYLLGVEEVMDLRCVLGDDALAGWSALPNGAGVVVRALCTSLSQGQALVERTMRENS